MLNVHVPPPHCCAESSVGPQPTRAGAEAAMNRCSTTASVTVVSSAAAAPIRAASRAPCWTDTPKTSPRPRSIMPSSMMSRTGKSSASSTSAWAGRFRLATAAAAFFRARASDTRGIGRSHSWPDRSQDDHAQRWEDEHRQWKDHLELELRGLLFGALAAEHPHLFGLDAQHSRDAHTQLLCLQDGGDEVIEVLDLGSQHHIPQRVSPRAADAHLRQDASELERQRVGALVHQPLDRAVEAESRLDPDDQQF